MSNLSSPSPWPSPSYMQQQQQQQHQQLAYKPHRLNDTDIPVYASSISSTETSPTPTSSSSAGMNASHTPSHSPAPSPSSDMRRPDSPRPVSGDAKSLAKVRLRQLVIWSDAAEDARDTSPIEAYIPPPSVSTSTPSSTTSSSSTCSLLQAQDQDHQQPQPLSHMTTSKDNIQYNHQKFDSNSLHAFTNKLRHLHQHQQTSTQYDKPTCNVEFPSSNSLSSSDDEEEDDDDVDSEDETENEIVDVDELNTRNKRHEEHSMGRLNKLELHIAHKRQSQILDRTQPSSWYNGAGHIEAHSSGLMRRKSFFNNKPSDHPYHPSKSTSFSRNESLWISDSSSTSFSSSHLNSNSQRNCYSTGYTNNNGTSQSIYGGSTVYGNGSNRKSSRFLTHSSTRCSVRRPQSFHRYARIVPDASLQGREKSSTAFTNQYHYERRQRQQRDDIDEFDDLIDGLHATKVTETPLQPQL